MGQKDRLAIYKQMIRSSAEYGSIVYHSLIPQYLADKLESVQRQALKIIFGFNKSSHQVLLQSGLESLSVRRARAVDKFALKLVADPRHSGRFPLRPPGQRRSRQSNKCVEFHANSTCLFNSPFFYMWRRLNAISASETVPTQTSTAGAVRGRGRANSSQRCDFIYDEWR